MLWRRRWTVSLITLASIALGVVYLVVATPLYTATSRLYIEQHDPVILTDAKGLTVRAKNYLFTQCEVITSIPILTHALQMAVTG